MLWRTGVVLVAFTLALSGCAVKGDGGGPADPGATPTGEQTPGAMPDDTPQGEGSPSPEPTATASVTPVTMPTDCRKILSDEVLAQLKDVPLNDPAFGPTGVQVDGSLQCIWRDPRADTTGLSTMISKMRRGPALEMLNGLVDEGFTCYTPDGGTRCEKTWANETYPVTDGRTLFWRDDVLIDTSYSNLAPSGYTSSIIASLFG